MAEEMKTAMLRRLKHRQTERETTSRRAEERRRRAKREEREEREERERTKRREEKRREPAGRARRNDQRCTFSLRAQLRARARQGLPLTALGLVKTSVLSVPDLKAPLLHPRDQRTMPDAV